MRRLNQKVIVLIPAYNEGAVLYHTIDSVVSAGYKVICVDDGSRDNTSAEALRAGAILIKHQLNLGQGAALETGLEFLRRRPGLFEYVATFDADGQHNVLDIVEMLKIIESNNVNVVLGTRFGSIPFQGSKIKAGLLQISAKVAQKSIGIKVTDRHNGLRLFDKDALDRIRLTEPGFGHADEILRLIHVYGLRYKECPVNISYTEYSKAKGQPLINILNIVFDRMLKPK